jgi:hypothetical protein
LKMPCCWFLKWRKRPWVKEYRWTLKAEKWKRNRFFPRASRTNVAWFTLQGFGCVCVYLFVSSFCLVKSISDSDFQNCQ